MGQIPYLIHYLGLHVFRVPNLRVNVENLAVFLKIKESIFNDINLCPPLSGY
jgi:hypothetical protein